MKIGLIPLDERPANTRYPVMLARISGDEVLLPPPDALSHRRAPASRTALAAWLEAHAGALDALIVSFEMLGYGGLIPSRISHDPASAILDHLTVLRAIRASHPDLTILGFNVITRVSRHNDATEEPDYWAQYGAALFRLSELTDRTAQGHPVAAERASLRERIPDEHVRDFMGRRARNLRVNRAALEMLADGTLDLLVLSSDDTSPYGLPSQDKRALRAYADALGLGDSLLMYPGADEVGCVLLARLVNARAGAPLRVQPVYMVPGGERIAAPFEDSAVSVTVERQVQAAGAHLVDRDADVLLFVNPPLAPDAEWPRDYTPAEVTARGAHLESAVRRIAEAVEAGRQVAVADAAHANGADARLLDLLRDHVPLDRLAAFAAWNTAANTIGTALAQASVARHARTPAQQEAQRAFLAHRFIEDWAYQRLTRDRLRDWLEGTTGRREPEAERLDAAHAWIAAELRAGLDALPPFARYTVQDVRLPWGRTFEVDFTLAPG